MQTIEEKVTAAQKTRAVRYTPPKCWDEEHNGEGGRVDQVCSHAEGFHKPSGARIAGHAFYGLCRRHDGRLVPKVEDFAKQYAIPARTRENIAACAAVGLSYWSEAPGTRLYGIDDHQQAREVDIRRGAGMARGLDGKWVPFTTPADLDQTMELF